MRQLALALLLPGCWLDFGGFVVCGTDGAPPCPVDGAQADGGLLDDAGHAPDAEEPLDAGTDAPSRIWTLSAGPSAGGGVTCGLVLAETEDGLGAGLARSANDEPMWYGDYAVTSCLTARAEIASPARLVVAATSAACGITCSPEYCGTALRVIVVEDGTARQVDLVAGWNDVPLGPARVIRVCRTGDSSLRDQAQVDYLGAP